MLRLRGETSSFVCRTVYYPTKGVGISILAGSIFRVGVGFKVIEGQSFSTGGASISNPNRTCKKLRGRFGNVKYGGWRLAVGGRRSAVGGRRSAVGGRRLAVGGWRLAVGGGRWAVGGRRVPTATPSYQSELIR
jgi:hypothetical protein